MARRRKFLQSLAGLPAALMAGPRALPDGTISESQARLTREAFGELRVYYEGSTGQVKSMTAGSLRLKPGMSPHPPHAHPEEEFMVITEGTGEIVVEGRTSKVGPGAMMYCAANKQHGIRNTGSVPLLFFYYKWRA